MRKANVANGSYPHQVECPWVNRIHRYLVKHHQETFTTLAHLVAEIDADKQHRRPLERSVAMNGSGELPECARTEQAVQ